MTGVRVRDVLEFECHRGVVCLGLQYHLVPGPLYIVPKGNLRIARTGRRGAGGPAWEALQGFEAAIVLGARGARAIELDEWDLSGRFAARIDLRLGDRPDVRGQTARARCRRIGCDNAAKGILDALEGICWEDDEMNEDLRVIKRAQPGVVGDCVRIQIRRIS